MVDLLDLDCVFLVGMQKKEMHLKNASLKFCAQDETRTHTALRPLPPQSSVYTNFTTCAGTIKKMSGKRDSNPRPQPWQGCALPTELFPQISLNFARFLPLICGCKVTAFF